MNHKYKIITIILLAAIAVLLLAALFMLPNKVLVFILLGIYVLGLFVYYIFSGNKQKYDKAERKKYSDILIVEELDRFFSKRKPYLNANYKISDLEKQLKVTRNAINTFTKERFGTDFNQFLNLWRIAELKRLQSLLENEDISINKLCLKAGFSNVQQYYLAEKERKTRKKKKIKNKPTIKTSENNKVNDWEIERKPEIQIRV